MNKPSVVEINGHRYDAVTGRLLNGVQRAVSGVGSVDGIVRTKSRHLRQHSQRRVHEIKRKTQRSQTLMRNVVKKPISNKSPAKKTLIHHQVGRDLRAKLNGLKPKSRSQAVARQHHSVVQEGEVINRGQRSAMAVAAPMPNLSNNLSHQRLERLLDYALLRADAHQQSRDEVHGAAKLWHVLPRWVNFTIITVLALAIGSFIAWQKVPAISLKVAASKAHVDSSAPTIPGYSVASPAGVKDGAVKIQYRAIADSAKTVTVTKKTIAQSEVSSVAKKECPNDKQVQTFQQIGSVGVICGQTNKAIGITNGVATEIQSNGGRPIDSEVSSAITGQ